MASNKSLDIQEVTVGSAANFRGTINDNFNEIKNKWTGIVRTNTQQVANNTLEVGGIWLQTESSNDPNVTTGMNDNSIKGVAIRGELITAEVSEYDLDPSFEGEMIYLIDGLTEEYEANFDNGSFSSVCIAVRVADSGSLYWRDIITGALFDKIHITINSVDPK